MNYKGMEIVVSSLIKPVPKLQLSHDFNACSDEMKHSMNRWLLEKFGTKEVCYMTGGKIIMSQGHYDALRRANYGSD